jgi:hypothetical protein
LAAMSNASGHWISGNTATTGGSIPIQNGNRLER